MRVKWLTACALCLLLSPLTGVVDSAGAAQDTREWTTGDLADAGISIDYPTGWTEVVPAVPLGPVELAAYLRGDGHEAAEYWGIDTTGTADQVYAEWNSYAQDFAFFAMRSRVRGGNLVVTVSPYRWSDSARLTGWWKSLDEFKRTTLRGQGPRAGKAKSSRLLPPGSVGDRPSSGSRGFPEANSPMGVTTQRRSTGTWRSWELTVASFGSTWSRTWTMTCRQRERSFEA